MGGLDVVRVRQIGDCLRHTQHLQHATIELRQLVQRIAGLLESREEVLEAYLFGSHARAQAQPHSDIDVAVYVDEARADDACYGYRSRLTAALMAGLETDRVDIVVLNRAPPLLYHRVLRDGIRILCMAN